MALITGAGRGLGRQIALAFARAGADIVGTARTKAQLEDTTKEIKSLGRRALPVVTMNSSLQRRPGLQSAARG